MTDYNWTCPAGVTKVHVELWAQGGGGRIGQNDGFGDTWPGCGGGGGDYSLKKNQTVIPGNTYLVRVGDAGGSGQAGFDSAFISPANQNARGGQQGGFQTPGLGGQGGTNPTVGDVTNTGGDGGPYPGSVVSPGTGGGSSAGQQAPGSAGSTPAGGVSPDPQSGDGGDGGGPTTPGTVGNTPGGGGGGGGSGLVGGTGSSVGGIGGARLWDATTLDWPSVNPPWYPNEAPLAKFGSPPPDPPPPAPTIPASAFFL